MVSKDQVSDVIFVTYVKNITDELLQRTREDEVTYISVEGLDESMIDRITKFYTEIGWTVTREICPPDYDDLWFS